MKSTIFIARCAGYDGDTLYHHVCEAFRLLGGIRRYVKPGLKVLIKPNLCLPQPPERAITTHPVLIEQIARIMVEHGAIVTIGDNPIGKNSRELSKVLWETTGIDDIAGKYGCVKSMLDRHGFRKETINLHQKSFSYYISKEYLEADLVINVPKCKTHGLLGFTGAVKNIFGIVPGRSKVRLHSFAPAVAEFSQVIVDVFSKRRPELTFMDAIDGLEGDGPGVKGKKRTMGIFMASNDAVLIDATAARIMGIPADEILTTVAAAKRGLGNLTPQRSFFHGCRDLEEVTIKDISLPRTHRYQNLQVIRKMYEFAKFSLTIDPQTCEVCLLCAENCPVQCIRQVENRMYLDLDQCIQCLCCLEICPTGAVNASMNNFYRKLKQLGNKEISNA